MLALYAWIALGSALGGVARFALAGVFERAYGSDFPWGTLVVNVVGCLVIGAVAALAETHGRAFLGDSARHFVMTGVLGGFTTFSSFSLQTLVLARDGAWVAAAANALGSLVLCLVAVVAGYLAAQALVPPGA